MSLLIASVSSGLKHVANIIRNKPGQTASQFCGWVAWLFTLISTWTYWYSFQTTATPNGSYYYGGATLLYNWNCGIIGTGAGQYNPSAYCSFNELARGATSLDYIRVAGGVAFAFVLIALVLSLVANSIANMRLRGTLETSCSTLPFLRHALVPLVLYIPSFVFLLIAWASYIGIWRSNYDAEKLSYFTNSTTYTYLNPGPGFGLAVAAWVLTAPAAALYYVFRDEGKSKSVPAAGILPAGAAWKEGAGAPGFSVAASAYAAPPSTPAQAPSATTLNHGIEGSGRSLLVAQWTPVQPSAPPPTVQPASVVVENPFNASQAFEPSPLPPAQPPTAY